MKLQLHYQVPITRKHIEEAVRGDKKHCAIANAIVESDEDISGASVDTSFINVARHSTERVEKYRSPKIVRNFIIALDEKIDNATADDPKPFKLVLTDKEFVSERPRAMHQREKRAEVEARRYVADVVDRPLSEVTMDDVKEYYEDLGDDRAPEEYERKPVSSAKVKKAAKPSTAKRSYAKRQTMAGVFKKRQALASTK